MGIFRLGDTPRIDVHLRRSARARRLSLRVSRSDGRVTLTAPLGVPDRVALGFAEERAGWLRETLGALPPPVILAPGSTLPVEGRPVTIVAGRGRGPRREADTLALPPGREGPAARAYLKALARDRLSVLCDRHAAALGRRVAAITLRDTRSRWGSCTAEGRLMFSWRIAMAPPAVMDYLAAHEVAHLRHMDHSRAFWDCVAGLCPDHMAQRDWLTREGPALMAIRFE